MRTRTKAKPKVEPQPDKVEVEFKVVIRQGKKSKKPLPDFGLGPGVLGTQEGVYSDPNKRGFKSPMFGVQLMEDADILLKKLVKVEARAKGCPWHEVGT